MSITDMTSNALHDRPVEIEPGWGQGRATFGGLLAALLVARMRGEVADATMPLRTVTTMLMAPIEPGPVDVHAQVLRRGRSVVLLQGTLHQQGQVAVTAQAAFGAARPSSISVAARAARPAYPPPDSLPAIDVVPGLTPEFVQQVNLRPAHGALPFSGASEPDFGGWMSFRHAVEPSVEHVVALIDAWPPAMTPLLDGVRPVATMSWTLDLLEQPRPDDVQLQYRVHTDACSDGYGHTGAHVWRADGSLLAISRQTVAVFG